jgi:uncharacterized protein YndB with AHSA1/START domain
MTDRIEKTIELKAPVDRVWRALSDPAEFGAWFRVKLEDTAFRPGDISRGRMTYPGYEHLVWEARIVAVDRPSRFAFTWHPYAVDADTDYSDEPPTLVEFRLEPLGGGTRLTVTESGFDALPEHRREIALRMNEGGWSTQVKNIQAHVDA